jgi:iron complex outermembrane recepter protein
MANYKSLLVLALILFFTTAQGQTRTINGRVVDTDNKNIANASIHVLNTSLGTLSGEDGSFTFETSINSPVILVKAVGYAAQEIKISNADTEVIVILRERIEQLPDQVVTAEKEETDLLSVPYSVSALESGKIEQYRIWDTKDISSIVPNLYTSNPGDNRNVTSVRGITTTSYDPAVATYIDGVNQFSLDTYIAPLFDIERIEILRGPQSTLYGRNAMGGVINIITKAPGNKVSGFAETSVGNYGQQRYAAGVRLPLVENKLFLGVAGMFNKTNGFYTNQFDNSDFDKQQSFTGNYYLVYKPSNALSFTLNVKNHAYRNDGAFPLAYQEEALQLPFTVNQNAVAKMVDNTNNISLKALYQAPGFSVTSLTSYQSNHRYYKKPLDGDFSPIDGISIINDYGKDWNLGKVFTEEIKVSSIANEADRFSWTLGTYMFVQNSPVRQAVRFGEDAAFVGSPDTNYSIINSTESDNKGIALFGQASYQLTPELSITGGLRWDYENKEQSVRGQYQHDPDPQPMFDTQPDTAATTSYHAISPKASLLYMINENASVYATYTKGFRTGGLTQLSLDPSQPPLFTFAPEYSNNYEIGSKNQFWNNKLQLNVSAFYVTVTDTQVPTLILPDAITVIKNAGKLVSKGIEAELSLTPLRGLEVDYNIGIQNAEYKELALPQNGETVDLSGNKQVFSPANTSRLAVQYTFKAKNSPFQGFARAEHAYVGTTYFDLANAIKQSGYGLVHIRLGIAYKNVELSFWQRNVTDERYVSYAYDFGAIHFGEPRNYGFGLKASF